MQIALRRLLREKGLILVCMLSIALGFSLAANFYHHTNTPAIAAPAAKVDTTAAANLQSSFVAIAEKLEPSVVNITSEKVVQRPAMPSFDDFFFGPFGGPKQMPEPEPQTATGSGVIIRSDGYILTNNHVVAGADRVTVKLNDGREFKGEVKTDPRTDLALVKIDAKDLPAIELADSDKVKVGEWAIAIGNPFGLRNTVTVGVVSALRREATKDNMITQPDVIQTDASINPGNSGGPLVNIDGKIIGINFMIYSQTGGNMGIGFAIPSNVAKFVVTQLIEKGKVVRGYLGLEPIDLTPVTSGKLGAKQGALVQDVSKDSPADKGGVKRLDVITKINGQDVKNALELRRAVEKLAPGTDVKVTVLRDKAEKTLTVNLGEAPGIGGETNSPSGDEDKSGMQVQPLTPELANELGVDKDLQGVVVRKVQPGSPAYRAGVRPRDVILEIDNAPVTSVATFDKAVKQLKSGETAIVVVQRGERSQILEMKID